MDTRPSRQLCWHRRVLVAAGARSVSVLGPWKHAPGPAGLPRVLTRVLSAPRGWSHVGSSCPGPEWGVNLTQQGQEGWDQAQSGLRLRWTVWGRRSRPGPMAWTAEAAGLSQSREVCWDPRVLWPLLCTMTGTCTCPSPGWLAGAVLTFTWRLGLLDTEGQHEAWLILKAGDPATREAPRARGVSLAEAALGTWCPGSVCGCGSPCPCSSLRGPWLQAVLWAPSPPCVSAVAWRWRRRTRWVCCGDGSGRASSTTLAGHSRAGCTDTSTHDRGEEDGHPSTQPGGPCSVGGAWTPKFTVGTGSLWMEPSGMARGVPQESPL